MKKIYLYVVMWTFSSQVIVLIIHKLGIFSCVSDTEPNVWEKTFTFIWTLVTQTDKKGKNNIK